MRGLLTVPGEVAAPASFDPALRWRLHRQVAVRPESFGALLYHFGTRKLSFLKNRTVLDIVQSLGDHDDARSACRAAGIADENLGPYMHALGVLAASHMLVPDEPLARRAKDPDEPLARRAKDPDEPLARRTTSDEDQR